MRRAPRYPAGAAAVAALVLGTLSCVPQAEVASVTRSAPQTPQWEGRARLPAASLQAIAGAAARGGRLDEDLRYLTDIVGPRLTGSAALRRANEWTAQRLRELPLDTVWLEQFTVPAGWDRGPVFLMQLAPHRALLRATGLAWAPPTPGTVTGEVLIWQGRAAAVPSLAGLRVPDVRNGWLIFPEGAQDGLVRGIADDSTLALAAAGQAAGVLLSGPDDPTRMLRLGSPLHRPPLPHLLLPHESYDRLLRLVNGGIPARVEGSVAATLTPGSVSAYNTVAEIRGSEWPAEVVLVVVPLDSWDDSAPAADDAAVVATVMEAARILAVARVRPRRTIRFALLGGEMQEELGAAEYASRHAPALGRHVAIVRATAPLDDEERTPERITARVRPDLESFWHSVGNLGRDWSVPVAVRPHPAPRPSPLSAAGGPIFEIRVDARRAGDPGARAEGGAASAAHEAAQRIAIAALALAELETFPR